jgi:4-amino-4-deoxy-L-arabinose transferase-like glycosyltransferase
VIRSGANERTRGPLVVATAVFVVLISTSTRYGWFRDELYFRALGKRLGPAFVDVPIVTPAVARLTATLFGDSLVALRVWPALCVVGLVVTNASLCKKFGGDARSQTIAALAVACSPIALIFGHVFHYAPFDLLAWSLIVWCVVHLVAGVSPKWWLVVGVIVGVGYENKNLIVLVVIGLLVGIVSTGRSSILKSRWFFAGIVVAAVLAAPNLWWQMHHHLPEVQLARHIRSQTSVADRVLIVPFQVAFVGVPIVGLAISGARGLWNRPELRFLPVAYICVLMVVIASGGKHYYAAGLLPMFLAAGSIHKESNRPNKRIYVSLGVTATISALIGLPILPQSVVGASPVFAVYPDVVESIGWPSFVAQVTHVVEALSVTDRQHALLLTRNYGEASALDRFGPKLPAIWSSHNQYWLWGPPVEANKPSDEVVIAVGFDRAELEQVFASVEVVARIEMPHHIDSQEQRVSILLCRQRNQSWAETWPNLKKYS